MDIRFTTTSKKAEEILEKVSRKQRKLFIQEAVIFYEKALRKDKDLHSVFLEVEKETKTSIFD